MTLRLGGDGAITGCTSLENPDLTVSGLTISGSFDAEKVLVASGTAAAPSYTFSGDTDNGLYYAGTNSIGVSTAGTSAIVVDASQRVGIGTTSPVADLDIAPADSTATLRIQARTNTSPVSAIELMRGTNTTFGADIYADYRIKNDNAQLVFEYAASSTTTERLRIDSNGNVGIGNSSPGSKLDILGGSDASVIVTVNGADTSSEYLGLGINAGAAVITAGGNGSTSNALVFRTAPSGTETERMRIDSSGRLLIGTTTAGTAAADDLTVSTSGDTGITIRSGTSNSGSLMFADGTSGSASYRAGIDYYHSSDHMAFTTNGGNERMRIDSSGRLLINHTADTAPNGYESKLQLCDTSYQGASISIRRDQANSSGPALLFTKSRGTSKGANTVVQDGDILGLIDFYAADGTDVNSRPAQIRAEVDGTPGSNDTPGRLTFYTAADGSSAASERLRIDPTGMVRTRGTDASGALNVFSSIGGSTSANLILGQHSASDITSGTLSFLVYTNGNVVNSNNSYGSLSDVNLKENIVDANSQWADIKGVRVRNYNFKEETGNETFKQLGVVAQEVEEVSPGLVNTNKDGIKSVNYSVLYMKAVKALQEAMARIETLETKVAALEAE